MRIAAFYLYLLVATLLFTIHQQRRRYFPLRLTVIATTGALCVIFLHTHIADPSLCNLLTFSVGLSFMVLLGSFCYQVSWTEALFCAIAGYNVQFIQSTLAEMLHRSMALEYPELEYIRILSAVAVYPVAWLVFSRRLKKGQNVDINKRSLLILLTGAALIEIVICYNLRQFWKSVASPALLLNDGILLVVCSIAFLIIQFTLLLKKDLESELEIVQQMWHKEQNHFWMSRETVDAVNRKCHDMRHQIHSIGQSAHIDPQALAEMENTIGIYDSLYQTGCKALDIILVEKALVCQNSGITINCIADGARLRFMSDTDIYALFGNLLENAVHAVQDLDPEEKIIGLTIKTRGDLLSISSYNCYRGHVHMEDGLPVSSSGDTMNRGFGVKSIALIVRKYGGTITFQARDGMFNINILFPPMD